MVSPSETDPVRVEGDNSPDQPMKVLSADGTEWVDATPENVAAAPTVEEAAALQKARSEAPTVEEAEAFREAAKNPAEVEARERADALEKLLEQNAKTVAKDVRSAQPGDEDVLAEIIAAEKAGKNRKTVIDVAKAKIASLKEEAKPPKVEKPKKKKKAKKPKAPKIVIMGEIKDILGSFWKDDKGNIFVLDGKMGEPSGVYALRLTKRAGS